MKDVTVDENFANIFIVLLIDFGKSPAISMTHPSRRQKDPACFPLPIVFWDCFGRGSTLLNVFRGLFAS